MVFAFTPDDRPNRIFRFVDPGTLPDVNLLSIYVHESNLLIIDRVKFAALSDHEKRCVLRTHHPYHHTTEFEAFKQAA